MNQRVIDWLGVAGATVAALTVAATSFMGISNLMVASATAPEELAPLLAADEAPGVNGDIWLTGYVSPDMTVILDPALDKNGEPYEGSTPSPQALPMEEAAELGAQYVWTMTGESLDGKVVQMRYADRPYSSRAYWIATVADSAEELVIPECTGPVESDEGAYVGSVSSCPPLEEHLSFTLDALTGNPVTINPVTNHLTGTTADLGETRVVEATLAELEAMKYEAPSDTAEYAELVRQYAERHFKYSAVVSVEFERVGVGVVDRQEYIEAIQAGRDTTYPFHLTDRGLSMSFVVTDDTGRVAYVTIDKDSRLLTSLDTQDSDFIPGFQYEGEEGVG